MKTKVKIKIVIDIFMTLCLLFLMGYQFWPNAVHEWAGMGMIVLFAAHHCLNRSWYKNLLKNRYSFYRIIQTVFLLLLFIDMIALMISGVLLSNHVFAFLNLHGGVSFARVLHMVASYWGFVLMSIHLGMHGNMIVGMLKNVSHTNTVSSGKDFFLYPVIIVIIFYGLFVFVQRQIPSYMFMQTRFVFLDFSESLFVFYLDYLTMMMGFSLLGYYFLKALIKIHRK